MKSQINKLLAIEAIGSFLIVMPIIAIYWQDKGLSIQYIFVLQVIFSVAVVLFEVPSGYLADLFSRKGSLLLGAILGAVGFFIYYIATGFFEFVIAEITLAVAVAFISGANSAFLYDTLLQHDSSELHVKYSGKIFSATQISEAIAAIGSGFLLVFLSLETVFFVQFLVMVLAIPIALSLKEPEIISQTEEKKTIFQIIKFALHENKKLLSLNVFSGVVSASTFAMVWFVQPYWKEIGVSIIYFGYMWAILKVISSISSYFAHRVEQHLSFRTLFAIFAATPFVVYSLLGLGLGLYSLLIIPFMWVLRGFFHPISLDYVNRETDSSIRATVVSVSQLFERLLFAIISPFLGWVADIWSLETAFQVSGLIFGILAVLSFLFLYKNMSKVSFPS